MGWHCRAAGRLFGSDPSCARGSKQNATIQRHLVGFVKLERSASKKQRYVESGEQDGATSNAHSYSINSLGISVGRAEP